MSNELSKELKKRIQEGRLSNMDLDDPVIYRAVLKYNEAKMLKEQAKRRIPQ